MSSFSDYLNIDVAKQLLASPLFANRYIVTISGSGSAVTSVFNEKIGLMANTVSLPTFSYNAKQQYIGGININVPNMFEQGNIDITFYNTGKEYAAFKKWAEYHYNQSTRAYGYVNDILANVQIIEFDRKGDKILVHTFNGCTLYTYGGIQLAYEEASQVEVFNVSLYYRAYEVETSSPSLSNNKILNAAMSAVSKVLDVIPMPSLPKLSIPTPSNSNFI